MNLADKWAEFKARVIPADASAVQVREMKRAFHGGALVMFNLMTEAADQDEDTSVACLEALRVEAVYYFKNDLSQSPS